MSWRRPATPLLCCGNQALAAGPETRRRSVDGRVCLRNSPRPGESRSCLSGSPSVNVGLVPPVWQWHLGGEVSPNNKHLSIGIPVPHALYLRNTQPAYATTDIWADDLLNKSAHASDTRSSTHTLFAQELSQIANNNGILLKCVESRLLFQDEGITEPTRKRADMMLNTIFLKTPG